MRRSLGGTAPELGTVVEFPEVGGTPPSIRTPRGLTCPDLCSPEAVLEEELRLSCRDQPPVRRRKEYTRVEFDLNCSPPLAAAFTNRPGLLVRTGADARA